MSGSIGAEDGDLGFQIAPMVDVVFVLMLFFMACAGMRAPERELSTDLPGRTGWGHATIIIGITSDGRVTLNDDPFGEQDDRDLPKLRQWLKTAIEEFGDGDPILIQPAPEAVHQRLIDVLDAASASGVKHLSFI